MNMDIQNSNQNEDNRQEVDEWLLNVDLAQINPLLLDAIDYAEAFQN